MKIKIDRSYVDNPGFDCLLKVNLNSIEKIILQLSISNHSTNVSFLYKPILPDKFLKDECIYIINCITEDNLDYNGEIKSREFSIKNEELLDIKPNQIVNLECNISGYFDFKLNQKYKIIFNTWMPLISEDGHQIYQDVAEDNSTLPVFFLMESEWVFFDTYGLHHPIIY